MQLPNPPDPQKFPIIAQAIQYERLQRYMPTAAKNSQIAFEFYVWNCKISESFHSTLHYSEILCRNAFNNALIKRAGPEWYCDTTFRRLLDERFRKDLDSAVADEHRQHENKVTSHHIVSSLTFGFWDHLATKRFERYLWSSGTGSVFPHAPDHILREQVQRRIESVRRWRNRIAHHRAIFDKGPTNKHGEAIELIGWICPDTRSWVASLSQVPAFVAARPRP